MSFCCQGCRCSWRHDLSSGRSPAGLGRLTGHEVPTQKVQFSLRRFAPVCGKVVSVGGWLCKTDPTLPPFRTASSGATRPRSRAHTRRLANALNNQNRKTGCTTCSIGAGNPGRRYALYEPRNPGPPQRRAVCPASHRTGRPWDACPTTSSCTKPFTPRPSVCSSRLICC